MANVLLILTYLIPTLGIIAGLSTSITITLFSVIGSYIILKQKNYFIKGYKPHFIAAEFRWELLFVGWLLLTILWSVAPKESITYLLKTVAIGMLFAILIYNNEILSKYFKVNSKHLLAIIILAILLFYIEQFFNGVINKSFRYYVQGKKEDLYYTYYLDRGCALIALFTWVVICALLKAKQNIVAIVIYILVLILLLFSDALSAFLAFAISGLVFIITRFIFKSPKLLFLCLGFGVVLFIGLIFTIKSEKLLEYGDFLPFSAKHRLFIWEFASNKIKENPLTGWGYVAARKFPVSDSEMVYYQGVFLHPLPMHPHNHLLQILLESGVVGLVLYFILIYRYLIKWDDICNNLYSKQASDQKLQIVKIKNNIRAAGYSCFSVFFIISMISFNMWQYWWICSILWVWYMFLMVSKPTN